MIEFNEEYRKRDREFFQVLGERIPSRMLPHSVSNAEVFDVADRSLQAGRSLFAEEFGFVETPDEMIF